MKIIFIFIVINISFIYSQLDTIWTKKFGGEYWDWGYGIVEIEDGYFFSGIEYLNSQSDSSKAVFYRTDLNGELIWEYSYGDSGKVWSGNLVMANDGSLATIVSDYGNRNPVLIKMDIDGNLLLEKEFDVNLSQVYNLVNTADGGFAFLSSGVLYKTDSQGEVLWSQDGLGSESIPIIESNDNGIVIVSQEMFDKRLIKFNSDGVELWESDLISELGTVWNVSRTQEYYIGSANGGLLFWDLNGVYIDFIDLNNSDQTYVWTRVWDVILVEDGSYYFSGIVYDDQSYPSAAIGNFTIDNTNEDFYNNFVLNWTSYFGYGRTYDFIYDNDGGFSMIGGCASDPDDFNTYDICLMKLESAGPPPPPPPPPTIVINEFLALNGSCCIDSEGDNDDYIELFNFGNDEVNVAGLYITDDMGNQQNYFQIPNVDNSTIIQPGDYLLLWADNESEQGTLHLGFKLNGTGEHLALYMANGDSLIDEISFDAQNVDVAYGRYPDGGEDWGFMNPSPGASNSEVLAIEESSSISETFTVHQNYPNPFNPVTSLRYDLPEEGLVNVTIHNMMGRVVKTLLNSSQTAGYKSIIWNATNNRNEPVSAGLYLYTIQAGEFRQTKKMVLLK